MRQDASDPLMGLPIYARQIARQDGSAIDVKTEASPLPVNKRPAPRGQDSHQQLPCLPESCPSVSATLTTTDFGRSSSRWLGIDS